MEKELAKPLRLSALLLLIAGLAHARQDMRIDQIRPALAAPGATIEIIGKNLDNPNLAKVVLISKLVDNVPTDFVDIREVSWVHGNLVRVNIPETLPAGDYLVKIETDASERRGRSNLQRIIIRDLKQNEFDDKMPTTAVRTTWPSVVIDRVTLQDETIALHGKHFGRNPGKRDVTIHQPDGESYVKQRLEVLSWDDTRIQLRLPDELPSGAYFVLINDEATSGSNSKAVIIPGPRELTFAPRK